MKVLRIVIAWVVLAYAAPEISSYAGESDGGFSFDISLGVAVFDTEEESKPEFDCEFEPIVFSKLQYTFDGGNQIYIGTPLENEGEPTIGATFGNGLVDVSAFYITPLDVYKDPYLTEREETTEDGFGGKIGLNIKSFKAGYGLRYTKVKDDAVAKRLRRLSREVLTHNLSASYNFEVFGLFSIEPSLAATFAMNNRMDENRDNDEWAESYKGGGIGISMTKMMGNVIVILSAKSSENHYANEDPVYNEKRVDTVGSITGFASWLAPLGYEKYSLMAVGGVETHDSSIEFYDKEEVFGCMTLGYHF